MVAFSSMTIRRISKVSPLPIARELMVRLSPSPLVSKSAESERTMGLPGSLLLF